MSARYLEVAQDDVIWGNLNINPYQQRARYAISWAMTIGLIVLWSFPGTPRLAPAVSAKSHPLTF